MKGTVRQRRTKRHTKGGIQVDGYRGKWGDEREMEAKVRRTRRGDEIAPSSSTEF